MTITTKLVKDGNSIAVRLPKTLLGLSGLKGNVNLEAKKGQIIVSQAKQPRGNWQTQIDKVAATNVHKKRDLELEDWDTTTADGLDD
jgi:antitoxin component of MazEF toxin-antitoxin module